MFDNNEVVCRGYWYYNKDTKTGVAIQKMDIIYGTGDYEDPLEIQNDRQINNYYIWFATAGSLDDFKSGGGYELTKEKAKRKAEELVNQKIEWIDE